MDLAKRILPMADENLIEVSRMGIHDLMEFKGIGEAKAITLVAALELGKRRNESEILARKRSPAARMLSRSSGA